MGFIRKVLNAGNNIDIPKKSDTVRLEYTGYLFDESKDTNDYKGAHYIMKFVPTHNFDC